MKQMVVRTGVCGDSQQGGKVKPKMKRTELRRTKYKKYDKK